MPVREGGTDPGKLSRGWRKLALIRELAEGEKTRAQLGAEYGSTAKAISNFAKAHAREIDQARESIDDEIGLLWVSKKANRIAEYQQMIEDLTAELEELTSPADPDDRVGYMSKDVRDIVKIKGALLHDVADEMGQLPVRAQGLLDSVTVVHQIVGVPDEPDLT